MHGIITWVWPPASTASVELLVTSSTSKTKPMLVLCLGEGEGRAIQRIPGPPELSQSHCLHYLCSSFCSPLVVPSNFEKLGRCPRSSRSSCHAPACLGQKIKTCFAVCCLLPQLQRGEDTEVTLAWKNKASRPFVPVLSWIASELSTFLSPSCSFWTSIPGGPRPSRGWEGFRLMTATTV